MPRRDKDVRHPEVLDRRQKKWVAWAGKSTKVTQTAGYGCTTCIGNSGPLHPALEEAIATHDLVAASVLSGNRNSEARVHQNIRANFLMSPPLVVAFALAGTVDIDLSSEPLGKDKEGKDVYLKESWPSLEEIRSTMLS